MRIRRNASKILGSATVCATPWLPPPTQAAAAFAVAANCSGIICQLNCSPWDVMPMSMSMPMDPDSCCYNNMFTNPKEEQEGGGIVGNNIKSQVREPISAVTRKSDGKGWHCKRPAQPPGSLCSYHLEQFRSYSRRTAADTSANDALGKGDNSSLYYYYYGSVQWRGKRRGKARVKAKVKEEVGEDMDSSMDHNDDDNVIGGDDEYDLDCFDEDDDDGDNLCPMPQDNKENGKKEGVEKKRVLKKRGRRPIKASSLRSLL